MACLASRRRRWDFYLSDERERIWSPCSSDWAWVSAYLLRIRLFWSSVTAEANSVLSLATARLLNFFSTSTIWVFLSIICSFAFSKFFCAILSYWAIWSSDWVLSLAYSSDFETLKLAFLTSCWILASWVSRLDTFDCSSWSIWRSCFKEDWRVMKVDSCWEEVWFSFCYSRPSWDCMLWI